MNKRLKLLEEKEIKIEENFKKEITDILREIKELTLFMKQQQGAMNTEHSILKIQFYWEELKILFIKLLTKCEIRKKNILNHGISQK